MPRVEPVFQYQEIAKELKEQILRGDFRPDGRLPSERALGLRFQVQRNTIRQALAVLERDGQISTENKRGSFIRIPPTQQNRNTFLVNIHAGSSPNLTRLMEGFHHMADQAGFQVRRINTHPTKGAALDRVPSPASLPDDTAGIVLWPQSPTDSEALTRLKESFPLVLVDRRALGVSTDCVRFDDLTGGHLVSEHLIQQGHRRIAFLADEMFAETVQQRWRGHALALEQAGIPVDPRLSLFFHGLDQPYFALSMRHLLTNCGERPTAIICSNDIVAFVLLRYLRDEGYRVPDDIAVTGYGNTMPDYTEAMALTSVDQPFFELGEAAARILIDRTAQTPVERLRNHHDITIPVKLIVRGSSAK